MNYFEFYQLPVRFALDKKLLKRKFFEYSRQFHPDYHLQASAEEQAKMLEKASYNNEAYQTLLNPDKRMRYILEINDLILKDEKYALPQSFLMQMMEINEELMELDFDFDEEKIKKLQLDIDVIEKELFHDIQKITDKEANYEKAELLKLKEYYFKKRYILRIRENLDKLAPA